MPPSDPHRHTHPEPGGHGEVFPRLEVAQAVAASQRGEERREQWAGGLWGLGAALLVLGLPSAYYVRPMGELLALDGLGRTPIGLYSLAVQFVRFAGGLGLEDAAFAVSAIFYGGSWMAMLALLAQLGLPRRLALIVTAVVLSSPLAWMGASLPLDFTAGLFGATWLATQLLRPSPGKGYQFLWRVGSGVLLAFLLCPRNLWLVLPACWAVAREGRRRGQPVLAPLALLLVIAVCVAITLAPQPEPWAFLGSLLVPTTLGSESWAEHLLYWVVALAALLPALLSLVASRREPEEAPPPTWMLAWLALAPLALVGGGIETGPRGAFLLPLAALGLGDLLHRRLPQPRWLLIGAALVTGHALLAMATTMSLERRDPHAPWLSTAHRALEAEDGIVTTSLPHAWLASQRDSKAVRLVDAAGNPLWITQQAEATQRRWVRDAAGGALAPEGSDSAWLLEDGGLRSTAP
ncbi:MAG: hypothetical protein R3F17_01745 [Planctomycetota bacterium]